MSSAIEPLLQKYSANIDTVREWAKTKYPQFLGNETLICRLFLIERGVRFTVPFQPQGAVKAISELGIGDTNTIQVAVVQLLESRGYCGCPTCNKKVPDATPGKEAQCLKCGIIVVPRTLYWHRFLVGDNSDELILSIPPTGGDKPKEGDVIIAEGTLGENEEFLTYRWTLAPQPPDGSIQQKPTVELPSTPIEPATLQCDFPGCGKIFSTKMQLVGHKNSHRKTRIKVPIQASGQAQLPTEKPTTPTAPPPEPPQAKQPEAAPTSTPPTETKLTQITEAVKRWVKVAGMIQKPADEFTKSFLEKFPGVNLDEALKAANCIIDNNGKIVFTGGT